MIGDPGVVEIPIDARLRQDPLQRIAADPGRAGPRMKERSHAELVARRTHSGPGLMLSRATRLVTAWMDPQSSVITTS